LDDAALGPLFEAPPDPHYLWILGVAVAAVGIAVAAVGLVRGRLPATLALPLVLLPLAAFATSALFLMEASKRVAFCGSCHVTMGPIVEALEDDDETLAAVHWQRGAVSHSQACYDCHSGYGIWGELDAKRAGIVHMLHTVTGGYEFPLDARRFDVDSCLGCHARARPFREVEEHRDPDVQRDILAGEITCIDACHEPAHPDSALSGWAVRRGEAP
jgi:cytochrome c nitrite reductase small subunit